MSHLSQSVQKNGTGYRAYSVLSNSTPGRNQLLYSELEFKLYDDVTLRARQKYAKPDGVICQ